MDGLAPERPPDTTAVASTRILVSMQNESDRNPLSQEGRTVIVTGGTKGIGRDIATRFLEAGADVVVCARSAPLDAVTASGRTATFLACDVRDADQIAGVVDQTIRAHGSIDVLVNNAGGAPPADSATASPRFNEKIVGLNLIAPISFAQAVHDQMQRQETGGVIINIASVSGTRANPLGVAYGAAKAGLLNATRTLAVEWAPKIRVVGVIAGMILTADARAFYGDDDSVTKIASTIPLGRMGEPADISDACLFLASPLASYVSGTALEVHGGGERPNYLDAGDAI